MVHVFRFNFFPLDIIILTLVSFSPLDSVFFLGDFRGKRILDLYFGISGKFQRLYVYKLCHIFQISSLLLRSVDHTSIPEWLWNCCRSLCCADVSQSALLFLCQGTLTMLDWQDGRMGPSGEALLLHTVRVLFTLSSQ